MRYFLPSDKNFIGHFFQLSQFCISFQFDNMNFLVNKKPKPPFSLKSIENSSLFQRRVSNTTCLIDNNPINRQMLINYNLNHVADKHDKITNTMTPKGADNSTSDDRKNLTTSGFGRNSMECQLGKTLVFQVNNGSV